MKNLKYSDFTDFEIQAAREEVLLASEYLREREDAYARAIKSAGRRWADKNKLPLVEQAKDRLAAAEGTLNNMLTYLEQEDSLRFNEAAFGTLNGEGEPEPEPLPWNAIGLAVGAIVLIVIVYKLI